MDSGIEILPLEHCPQYAPILAWWSYMEWYRQRDIDFDLVLYSYQSRSIYEGLPVTFVALYHGLPVGMASLKADDLWSRKDLNPWLASLYVHPEYRKQGTGSALITEIINETARRHFGGIYLFLAQKETAQLEAYYTKRGWRFKEKALDNDGIETAIYHYDLIQK